MDAHFLPLCKNRIYKCCCLTELAPPFGLPQWPPYLACEASERTRWLMGAGARQPPTRRLRSRHALLPVSIPKAPLATPPMESHKCQPSSRCGSAPNYLQRKAHLFPVTLHLFLISAAEVLESTIQSSILHSGLRQVDVDHLHHNNVQIYEGISRS